MKTLKQKVIDNRKNNTPLTVDYFTTKEEYENWTKAIEELRFIVSNCIKVNRDGMTETEVKKAKNEVFPLYKKTLEFLTDIDRMKVQDSDFNTLLTICTTERKAYKGIQQEILPVSKKKFRKSFENFIADRAMQVSCKTAFEIEQERKEKIKAKKEAKKQNKKQEVKESIKVKKAA